jgi:alkylated DNA repair protein alkB family protein 8
MGNKAGKPTRDDTGRASTSASDLAAKDANAAEAADAAAAASSSEPPTHEPVPGLRVVLDVLSEAQHDRVVAWLLDTLERGRAGALRGDTYAPIPDKWQKRNQSREMLQFGTYTHSNRVESFRDVEAMPEALSAVVECLRTAGVYGKQTVDDGVSYDETCETHALPTSCTVNFYEKGQWIPPHIDNPAFDRPVVTVSLRSTQCMTLGRGIEHDYAREHEHASCRSGTDDFPATRDDDAVYASSSSERDGEKNDRLVTVALPRRSAVVLRGAAADEYEHAIPPVSSPRISLTFRTLGDPNAAATKARIARADARRARYRAERARATSSAPRRGYGPVGPKGAVGRVGPLPEDVAAAEARRRAREGAVAAKREKKYRNAEGGSEGGSGDAAVPGAPKLSKARAKKEARKAARAAARTKRRTEAQTAQTDATSTDATSTDASIALYERTEKDNSTTTTTTTFAISADGVTRVERRAKTRSCPPCPPELLPEATIEKGGDREGDGFGMTNDGVEAEAEAGKKKRSSNRKNVGVIPSVELENVQRVYDAVARQWHGTRYRAWSGVEDFVTKKCAVRGALVADVGCGNGKNAPAVMRAGLERGGAQVIGCDFSMGLLEICANERDANDGGSEVFAADAARLPLRSRVFDAALNVAVLHHVSTASRRFALVAETMRVLRVGGVALFYAWALEQETGGVSGHRFESQDVLVPFHKRAETKKKKASEESEESESGNKNDVSTEARVFQRYCHVYKEGELEALFDPLSEWCRVDRVYYDCGNWCAEVTRTK